MNEIIKLTPEEIEYIHLKGKHTPAEMLEIWERPGSRCPVPDLLGSTPPTCLLFSGDCHACMIDYANSKREW